MTLTFAVSGIGIVRYPTFRQSSLIATSVFPNGSTPRVTKASHLSLLRHVELDDAMYKLIYASRRR